MCIAQYYKTPYSVGISICSDGGIGIRTGLKILGPQGIEGSSPSPSKMAIMYPKNLQIKFQVT